jgi:hypothetical protein
VAAQLTESVATKQSKVLLAHGTPGLDKTRPRHRGVRQRLEPKPSSPNDLLKVSRGLGERLYDVLGFVVATFQVGIREPDAPMQDLGAFIP